MSRTSAYFYDPSQNRSLARLEHMFARGTLGELILVGIEPKNRLDEYTPWHAKALSDPYPDFGGQDSHYLSFLVEKLKPYIDRKYKTDGRREQTGIIGASLGGLISIYAAYLYPDVFGKIVPYPDRFGTKASSILCGRKTPIPD